MVEIKLCGRGGQGVVLAGQMLGQAFFEAGLYPQGYSVYGGERRGAPLVSYLRVDRNKILLKCAVKRADELICLDASLLDPEEVSGQLRPGGRILINTARSESEFQALRGFRLGLVDAEAAASGLGLGRAVNTALLGAYARFSGRLGLEHVLAAIAELAPARREANLEAARRAHESLRILEPMGEE